MVGPGEGRDLASSGLARGWRDPEQRDGRLAGRIVELVGELRKTKVHQAQDAVAHSGLLVHKAHGEAGGLAKLSPGEWLSGLGSVDHAQGGEGTRVRGVALGALETTLGEVLCDERVDHRDGMARGAQMARQGLPIVTARLEDDPLDRTLARDP